MLRRKDLKYYEKKIFSKTQVFSEINSALQ